MDEMRKEITKVSAGMQDLESSQRHTVREMAVLAVTAAIASRAP